MGVWGPHGNRIERKMRFTNHYIDSAGSWKTMEHARADCYDTWEEAWKVFRSGAIMDGLALPAILDRYMAEFRERCYRYPTACHICYRAEMLCRTE
eukprot:8825861-Heterocapsa_arctica.AAC.1